MKKHKKLILSLSIVFGVVALLAILSFTLFGLDKVSLDFRNETTIFADEEDQKTIIKSGDFKRFSCVFFIDKSKYINKLEKKYPYLKIINIETSFPNDFIIHCAEREPLYAIQEGTTKKYYVVDSDFKILFIEDYSSTPNDYSSVNTNAILLKGISVLNTNATAGDFLSYTQDETIVKSIHTSLYINNRDVSEQRSFFKSIELSFNAFGNPYLTIYDFNNFKMQILNVQDKLNDKVQVLLSAYDNILPSEYGTKMLTVNYNSTDGVFAIKSNLS